MISNRFSVYLQKRETSLKWLVAAFTYFLLFALIENPAVCTISDIGTKRLWFFSVFCTLLPLAFLTNYRYTLRVYKIKANILNKVMYFNLITAIATVTVMPLAGTEPTLVATIFHWMAGFGTIIANSVISLMFLFKVSLKYKSVTQTVLCVIGTIIASADGICFLVFAAIKRSPDAAKNGLFEIIPLCVAFSALYFTNHIDAKYPRIQRDELDKALVPYNNKNLNAIASALLLICAYAFSTFIFTRNPLYYTISAIGIQYRAGFIFICGILIATYIFNFSELFTKYNCKNIFVWLIALLSSASFALCIFDEASQKLLDTGIYHACGALVFYLLPLFTMMLFSFIKRKENKTFSKIAIINGVALSLCSAMIFTEIVILKGSFGPTGRSGIPAIISVETILLSFYILNFKINSICEVK